MGGQYDGPRRLASIAARLRAGAHDLPTLFLFTDPARTPDPVAAALRLPPGCGVVYRHFGAAGRRATAADLRAVCDAAGHLLLIAGDPDLAHSVGADGAHWTRRAPLPGRTRMRRFPLNSASAHDAWSAMRAARDGADLIFLSPVFPSRSPSAGRPLGLFRAASIARAASVPVFALGGIDANAARRLIGVGGVGGVAAVDGLTR